MEEKKFSVNGVYQKSKEYIDTRFKLFKLKLVERSSRLIASLITDGLKGILAVFVIFYLSLALGFYLSELLGSSALGFLASGGLFVLLIIVVSAFDGPLERFFMNLSIKRVLQKWNEIGRAHV